MNPSDTSEFRCACEVNNMWQGVEYRLEHIFWFHDLFVLSSPLSLNTVCVCVYVCVCVCVCVNRVVGAVVEEQLFWAVFQASSVVQRVYQEQVAKV